MSISQFTPNDYALIAEAYEGLKQLARKRCPDDKEFAVIQKAFEFANEAHKNVRRRSGEPYILHPIAVARIVVENIGLGYKSISAALLHDVVEDTEYTTEDIRNLFGDKIASLVDGLTKMKTVLDNQDKKDRKYDDMESLQAENLKRILLTLNDDVRVALVKLADRLHNCRTIEFMPEHKRDKILSETMFIFVPLAHRLGLYEVKSEMENIWLRFKEPDAFREITERISRNVSDRDIQIDEFIAPINTALRNAGFSFEIKKRVKTPYSIWHKMVTKNVEFEQIYDLYAVRIIFDSDLSQEDSERDMCYHIFSIITSIYKYLPNRMRDWVRHPKSNGYEALHCTLMSQMGIWVEVQIRSRRMDDIAEKGIAAHWTYKQDGYVSENNSEMDKWLLKLKEVLETSDINALELLDIVHNDLVSTDIVVFTPQGEQKTIEKGATALDFAYMIHSEIGNKAIAAKVNMKLVPLTYVLKSGDQVEIITAQNSRPKSEWLKFLKTRHARNAVIEAFHDYRPEITALGRKLFYEELEKHGIKVKNKASNKNVQKILHYSHLNDIEEFCFRFGLGIIPASNIGAALSEGKEKVQDFHYATGVDVDGVKYVIATCCNPIPGDAVVGFKGEDGVVTIHKKSCPEAEELGSKFGNRIVSPHWDKIRGVWEEKTYPVRISLMGIDRMGMLNEISRCISHIVGINIRKVYLGTEEGIFEGYVEVLVNDKTNLDRVITELHSIEGIQKIVRTEI